MPLTSGNRSGPNCKYVYDLPYVERKTLCNILDLNDQWERLGGEEMGFSVLELSEIKRAERSGESPSDRLLQYWGQKNNTILSLYFLLYSMEHFQAMSVLLPFIPEKYHYNNLQEELMLEPSESARPIKKESTLPKPCASLLVDLRPRKEPSCEAERRRRYSNSERSPLTVGRERDPNLLKEGSESLIGSLKAKSKVPNHFLETQKRREAVPEGPSGTEPPQKWTKDGNSISDKILNTVAPPPPNTKYGAFSSNEDNLESNDEKELPKGHGSKTKGGASSHEKESPPLMNQVEVGGAALPDSRKRCQSNCSEFSTLSDCGVTMIPYKELEEATSFWSRSQLLGSGGFGSVFKGTWINLNVAIKRINNSQKTPQTSSSASQMSQIMDELRYLLKYRHDNILQVYGFSADPGKPHCLVYQFMANGSLDYRLQCKKMEVFSEISPSPLTWRQRFIIAKGSAAALQFLHTVQEKPLIHGDVKSANILLDGYLQPKLGDFGLAREGPQNDFTSMKVSHVHGTKPYIPEEYLRSKKLSIKVDTYSYGIVLFEICSGRRAYNDKSGKYLRDDVVETTDKKSLIDAKAGSEDIRVFDILLKIGMDCIERLAKKRPDMTTVFVELENFWKHFQEQSRNKRTSVEDYQNGLSSQNPDSRSLYAYPPFVHPQRIIHPPLMPFSTSPPMSLPYPNHAAVVSKSTVPPQIVPIPPHIAWMKGLSIHSPSHDALTHHQLAPTSNPPLIYQDAESPPQKASIPQEGTAPAPANAGVPLIPNFSLLIHKSSSETPENQDSYSSTSSSSSSSSSSTSSSSSSSESLNQPSENSPESQSLNSKRPGTTTTTTAAAAAPNVNEPPKKGSSTLTEICVPLLSQLGTVTRPPKTRKDSVEPTTNNTVSAQGKKTFLD